MLGIDFAKVPAGLIGISGMEFMDYQKPDLYNELHAVFAKYIGEDNVLKMDDAGEEKIQSIVMAHTGMLVNLNVGDEVGNAAVDTGWFSPGHLLNIKGLDQWLAAKDTNIGKAFKALKVNVLKGWVDTAKGRVGGDFSKMAIDLYIQERLNMFMREKFLQRYKCSAAEALAMIVLHECGHAFTGFLYVVKTYMDSMMTMCAVRLINDNNVYGKERVTVIKETLSILECDTKVEEKDVANLDADGLTVYFNKATTNRDYRRTLSLGTADRGSEVFADLFAIRYGAPKILVAGLASLPTYYGFFFTHSVLWVAVTVYCVLAAAPVAVLSGIFLTAITLLNGLDILLNPSDMYDSAYRRLKNILRDQVIRLNEDKRIPAKDKVQMLKDAKEMEKIVDEQKPFLEGTAVQRLTGWIMSGSDFKLQQFEHYNEELLAHTLSLYKDAF